MPCLSQMDALSAKYLHLLCETVVDQFSNRLNTPEIAVCLRLSPILPLKIWQNSFFNSTIWNNSFSSNKHSFWAKFEEFQGSRPQSTTFVTMYHVPNTTVFENVKSDIKECQGWYYVYISSFKLDIMVTHYKKIEGHRIHLLGSLANPANMGRIGYAA